LAIRYATDNPDNAADFWQVAEILHDPDGAAARVRDHAAEMLAEGKPPMDEARRAWSRWASDDRLDAAAGSPRTTRGDVLRCARRVDAPDEAPDGTDRRPRPGPARAAHRFYTDGTSFADQLALARQMLPLIYGDAGT
jgi:hypothetical protein